MTGSTPDAFAALLARGESVDVPGCYDALSARLVQEAGFGAVYIGSYATAATRALPDVGLLTMLELARHAEAVVAAVGIPVIADAEDGFVDAANIWRTVRSFEQTGVSAVHLEDHAGGGGKHTELGRGLIPLDTMLGRLTAAVDARRDPGLRTIARTDAIWATGDLDEAVCRMQAFAEVGADLVMPTGITPEQLRAVRQDVSSPVVVVDAEESGVPRDFSGAADLVLHYGFCLFAAVRSVRGALAQLSDRRDPQSMAAGQEPPSRGPPRLRRVREPCPPVRPRAGDRAVRSPYVASGRAGASGSRPRSWKTCLATKTAFRAFGKPQ